MSKQILVLYFIIFLLSFTIAKSQELENCEWNNKLGTPCLNVYKTPNTSIISENSVDKTTITKKEIIDSGAVDIIDTLNLVSGLDIFQNGSMGQSTSIFTRGSESNHTLVMLNGISINDQSVTDGLHDFGQDFVQTIQQIEVYKGSNGVHFGPNAIAGAINFITDIDYKNSITLNGYDGNNFVVDGNYTSVNKNGFHYNIKASKAQSKTNSAIAGGSESDGVNNYQINFNSSKWIKDNLKFKSTLYSRNTKSDYDGSATNEQGYNSDNSMYAVQSSIEHKSKKSSGDIKFHYHNYDRKYENEGVLDEYYSEAFVVKGENKYLINERLSFGYGSEYKYDWGNFENKGSYTASTRGHVENLGLFGNFGLKIKEDTIFSTYYRSDNHKLTGLNETYKVNLLKNFNKLKLSTTHSTGLRNPTLYELFGTDNYGIKGNTNLNPEKSKTNEISLNYEISKNISFNSTLYETNIFDRIEANSSYTKHVNLSSEINQEGLENVFILKNNNQSLKIFSNFSKSRKDNGQAQNRRPDLTLGGNYSQSINQSIIGDFNFNINYKHNGKYSDWDGEKNSRQKSVDLIDVNFNKEIYGNIYSLKITNLLDKKYEKPATYNQDGRKISFSLKNQF